MRVLITAVNRFTEPTGICKHAANLARALGTVPDMQQVTLLIGPWQIKYFEKAFGAVSSSKVSIVPATLDNSSLERNKWYLANLPQVVRRERFDIVHLSFPAPVIARAVKAAVVTTLHDLYPYARKPSSKVVRFHELVAIMVEAEWISYLRCACRGHSLLGSRR
jgi:hypothetical protein